MAFDIRTHHVTLADALRSPMTTPAELRQIEAGALATGRPAIATAARVELARRADATSAAPFYLRVAAAVARDKRAGR